MVHCPLVAGDVEDPERLKRFINHSPTATSAVLERLVGFLGAENRLSDLRREHLSPTEYRRRLIDVYVEELFADGAVERERLRYAERAERERAEEEAEREIEEAAREAAAEAAAEAILEGRPDRSGELEAVLRETPWPCPVCLEEFKDANRIYVTCHRGENALLNYAQHKACDACSRRVEICPICRAPGQRLPLPRAWNGVLPLEMRMGGNPFLVGAMPLR